MDLENATNEELKDFIASWDGENELFIYEDSIYHEDNIDRAEEELSKRQSKMRD